MIVLVIGLFVLLTLYSYSYREGMEEDSLALAIQSIEKASKDVRMDETQRHALENAHSYAKFIKHMPN
jgi:hypothetical protein